MQADHGDFVMSRGRERTRSLRVLVSFLAAAAAMLTALAGTAFGQETGAQPVVEDTAYVIYDEGPITLPFGIGLRIPSYNRVDGLVVPWGPDVKLGDRIRLAPTISYRSHIGELDPYLTGQVAFTGADTLRVMMGRTTLSNDTWIRSDLMNSLAAIGVGTDARNYYRADHGVVELFHSIPGVTTTVTPSIGVLHEFAWSTGEPGPHTNGPWSVFGKSDDLRMLRPNPAIARGHTTSLLGGLRIDFDDRITRARMGARVEHALDAPERENGTASPDFGDFTQLTIDARADFPTFGLQHFTFRGHGVVTRGDAAPQRYAYVGGGGTLSTVDLLALGGDRLVFVEGEYFYPLRAPVLRLAGAPVISLRYAAASAGVRELPDFIQNVGIGIGLRIVKIMFHVDPSYRDTGFSSRTAFSLGFSLPL